MNQHFKKMKLSYIKNLTPYYRLLIPKVLPQYVDKAFYLDADMVVNGSLSELYHTELGDNYIAGVRDAYISHIGYLPNDNFHKGDLYINAGMLLCNLNKIRQDNLAEKFINMIYLLRQLDLIFMSLISNLK